MLMGDAIERQLVSAVYTQMVVDGYIVKTQVQIGGANPLEGATRPWHGYLDLQVAKREGNTWVKFPIEIKTKSGFGARMFWERPAPDKSYMMQIGLYLHELHRQEGITDGLFHYILLSDDHFGDNVFVHVRYNPGNHTINAHFFERSDGTSGKLAVEYNVMEAFERFRRLDRALETGVVPEPEYQYKYSLTPDLLRSLSDNQLKKLMDGTAIIGDWQPLYSRYKNLQFEVDNITPERSDEEKALARSEYRRRHPKSKL